ncbi:hypothetical protein IWC96_12735 [Brevundimonas sp. BAL450]|uniref:hypothetical protein n=1 Tax=Brevundimonas TaxID=41275 RepID=UPI0011D1915E|nr:MULTISPECIES: hypothetical protein [Brevundimonas]MBG7616136.1 hypothetical protein [Brevundimonas sp. BAL450]
MKKLRLKSGQFEIELESDDLKGDLEIIFQAVPFLSDNPSGKAESRPPQTAGFAPAEAEQDPALSQGINSYVAKLRAGSAREMMRAASYHLTFNDGLDEFTKEELYARCKQARDWKADHSNQQAINLHRMVKSGELTERVGGKYCVPSKKLEEAKSVLLND